MLVMLIFYEWTSISCSIGFWWLYDASFSFLAYDSVLIWLMSVFPVCHQIYKQENISETLKPSLLYWVFWDCVGLFLHSLETISGTNIFGTISRDEVEDIFSLGYLSVLLVLRGELKPELFEGYFSPKFDTVATRGVGRIRRFQSSPTLCSPN